ncbi:LamG-like jellyroll fold domain-containing protein [Streptomyces sp. NPDC020875]|uniref:LamG-like jellyroll fold domain-containing protein n=1 Tax=Streptomyces sp. NPDC020875 TaxID=3154898 RepID=UPI0033D90459
MRHRTRKRTGTRTAVVAGLLLSMLGASVTTAQSAARGPAAEAPRAKPRPAAEQPRSAPDERRARAVAETSGRKVEVTALRDERSETWANPDGTFTRKEYALPVRALKNGKWTEVDTRLTRLPGGRLTPRAATAAMTFGGEGDRVFATLVRDGRSFSVSWPDPLPRPKVNGSAATYRGVLPGVDLVVRAEADGFSHLLVVKSAKAAAHPRLAALSLPLTSAGLRLSRGADGGLKAADHTGGTVFEAPQPVMWDSGPAPVRPPDGVPAAAPPEGARVADVGLRVDRGSLALTPDPRLLRGAGTRYPVYIDPVARTATRTGWTWVSSGNPGLEGWKFPNSDDGVESGKGVGRCPANVSVRCANTNDVQRQYYALPTGGFEGKTILSAEFSITLVHTYNSELRPVELHRMNSGGSSAINSGTNWNNKPTSKGLIDTASAATPTGSCTATNQNVRFNVKSALQSAANKGWDTSTFGLMAASEDSYASWKRFCNNGALEVTYNRLPYQPLMSELTMSPGGKCTYGQSAEHLVNAAPRLNAVVWDPDHGDAGGNSEQVRAQFAVFWTAADGTVKRHTVTTGYKTTRNDPEREHSGWQRFQYTAGTDLPGDGTGAFTLPQNTVIGWESRAGDEHGWSPWSSEGSATRCEFLLDSTKPAAPTVTSTDYPDDELWHSGIGDYGSFSFYSPGIDIVKYTYTFSGEETRSVVPEEPNRPATVRWMPKTFGSKTLEVSAVDQAGNKQYLKQTYVFDVARGRSPKASWSLADPAGSPRAVGGDGAPDATAGSGVTFGVDGPHGSVLTAAELDGGPNAYLSAGRSVVDTGKTFAVSAWVLLPTVPTTSMTVVSQDGIAQSGFSLGFDASTGRWSFVTPDTDLDSMLSWQVLGPRPVAGEWTHLVGVYDRDERSSASSRGSLRMYVNGTLVPGQVQERPTTWNASGPLQIGRALNHSGYTANLRGSVAGVQIFDRVVTQAETRKLGGMAPDQRSYWAFEEAVNGVVADENGRTGLTLRGTATIPRPQDVCDELDPTCVPYTPLRGDGHLELAGTGAYADRGPGLLKPTAGFTITARARLGSIGGTADQTVLSLPGTQKSAALVRFDAAADRWQLAVTSRDLVFSTTTTSQAPGSLPSVTGRGDHLALAYNALFGEIRLYVNGVWSGESVPWIHNWDLSTTGLDIGRNGAGSQTGEYFSGALDEVRVFHGALDQSLIQTVAGLESGLSLGGSPGV